MSTTKLFARVAIIGVGHIGASLALAIRRGGLAGAIAGADASAKARETLARLGLVDTIHESPGEAVAGADLVVLATPLSAYTSVARAIGDHLAPGAIVTDVGSCKQAVIDALAPHLPLGVHFVPGHPVAGTEQSGPEAGMAELFENRWAILTPPPGADAAAVNRVRALWEGVGSMVEIMDARHHDRVLAVTSHLPHLIAYTIVGTADDLEGQMRDDREKSGDTVTTSEVIRYSAGGFRDFTRIAGSNAKMWRDVFVENREAVLEMLGRFTEDLAALQRAIRWSDGDALEAHFTRTRAIRRGVVDAGQAGTFRPTEPGAGGDGGATASESVVAGKVVPDRR